MSTKLRSFSTSERVSLVKQILAEVRLKATQWPIQAETPEPLGEQSGRWLAKQGEQALLSLSDEIEQGIASILADHRFTDEGKFEQLKSLADGLRTRFARIQKMAIERLGRELESTRSAFTKATAGTPGSDVVDFLRKMELRTYLRGLSDTQRLDVFWSAVQACDAEMVGAFESAPRSLKLIDQDTLNKGLAEFRRLANPALAAGLDDLENIRATIAGYLRNVEDALDILAGVEPSANIPPEGGSSK